MVQKCSRYRCDDSFVSRHVGLLLKSQSSLSGPSFLAWTVAIENQAVGSLIVACPGHVIISLIHISTLSCWVPLIALMLFLMTSYFLFLFFYLNNSVNSFQVGFGNLSEVVTTEIVYGFFCRVEIRLRVREITITRSIVVLVRQ